MTFREYSAQECKVERDQLRERLNFFLSFFPKRTYVLAVSIGISVNTLKAFLNETRSSSHVVRQKIKKYLDGFEGIKSE